MNESVPVVYLWSVFSSHCWSLIHDKDHVFEITEYGYKGISWTQWDLCWTHAFFMIMLQWSAASVSRCTKALLLPRVFSLQLCSFRFFFFFFFCILNWQMFKKGNLLVRTEGRWGGKMFMGYCGFHTSDNLFFLPLPKVFRCDCHHTHIHPVPLSVLGTITSHIVSCIPTWVQR